MRYFPWLTGMTDPIREVEMHKSGEESRIARWQQHLYWLYNKIRTRMRRRWRRDLPFDEMLFDRWERARALGFGEGVSMYHNCYVYGDVSIGEHTWIGPFTVLDGSGGLSIGAWCSISAGVQIYTHDSVQWALSGGDAPIDRASVRIGSRCYIGPNSIIAKGVTVGDGSVIGSNSVVLEDIPAGMRAAGAPCRVIGPV